ncbi:Glycosyltransferase involved in cell wall bisynthesis [Promicromonospora umidemergens]|uniref:Glycosyltransferase 2-like domain-containing protein n=1 Tax=Promicromonospora umidemergens TaxID=629679 RepID=A0ABP8WAZ6_9MICO|nr:glycosyltransferase [Promicromonospora umidemergens]MCP2284471.1 Glycosyltransferase involved in cell wall bisynthesis [Promicromonospora umidemergens]
MTTAAAATSATTDATVRPVDADVARGLAEQTIRRRDHLRAMAYTAGRTQADSYRRVVAAGIAPDLTYEELRDAARSSASTAAGLGRKRPGWWRALAMTVGYQNLTPDDLTDAAHLYRVARHMAPGGKWRPDETRLYLQVLQLTGAVDELESELTAVHELLEEDRLTLAVDLAAARHGVGSEEWNRKLDDLVGRWGVRPVRLTRDGRTPFDSLAAPGPSGTEDGPLVTVVMSAFRPGPEIFSAVRSILDQTWGNLELLVLDDASGPEFQDVLAEVARLDQRIRVLVQPQNRGTYAARNRAVREARGQFITFQDSDDWSHPERIARQVRPLLESGTVHSTISRSIRSTEDLGFQHLAKQTSRKNASSLMFPRAIIERLGAFDPIRKSADSEFIERLAAALPGEQILLDDQLAFVRLTAGSLSRGDFRARWVHPSRHEYTESYKTWHKAIRAGADPFVSPDPAQRSFQAPRRFAQDTGITVESPDLEVVLAGDFRADSYTMAPLYDELVALVEQGVRVGIMHIELAGRPETIPQRMSPEFRRMVDEGTVVHVLQTEEAHTDLLLIHDPAVLQLPPTEAQALDAERVAILAHRGGAESTGGALWSARDVTVAARDLFGKEPTWIPAGPAVRAELAAVPGLVVHDTDAVDPVLPHLWDARRLRTPSAQPVVGFASFEGADLWPASKDDFLAAYPTEDDVDVRLLGALEQVWSVIGRTPASRPAMEWLIYRPGDLSQRELFLQLDYVPCFPSDDVKQPPAYLTRAMAAGRVVIVPERFRPFYGDAAAYATPDGVLQLVRHLEQHPAERSELARAGAHHLETHHAADRFLKLVTGLLPSGSRARRDAPAAT